jgi:hypothetical protein
MSNNPFYLFANQAQPEEQGGFADLTSKITYCNESAEDMLNHSAVHSEHTGNKADIRTGSYDEDLNPDLSNLEDARFNTTILETDRLGSEYPARYGPGR